MKISKRITALLVALLISVSLVLPAGAIASPDVELSAASALVVNLETGREIYSRNADEQRSIASVTKMMTALVAYEAAGGNLAGTSITVPLDVWSYFDDWDISVSGLVAGETMSMYDIMHALLLPSGNEAAITLAVHFGYNEFIGMMNQKAAALGMSGTHFVNPHGLDADGNYSTAHDLMLLTKAFVAATPLYEITQKTFYTLPATEYAGERAIYSTNYAQIESSDSYYSPVRGIKTGSTELAGRCLVSTAVYDNTSYAIVLLGCGNSVFAETVSLYRWCFNNLSYYSPINANTAVTEIKVKSSSRKDALVLYSETDLFALFDASAAPEVTFKTHLPEKVKAPIAVGQVIGTADVFYNGEPAGTVNLISREEVKRNILVSALELVGAIVFSTPGMIVLGALFLILLVYLYYIKIALPRAARRKNRRNRR